MWYLVLVVVKEIRLVSPVKAGVSKIRNRFRVQVKSWTICTSRNWDTSSPTELFYYLAVVTYGMGMVRWFCIGKAYRYVVVYVVATVLE